MFNLWQIAFLYSLLLLVLSHRSSCRILVKFYLLGNFFFQWKYNLCGELLPKRLKIMHWYPENSEGNRQISSSIITQLIHKISRSTFKVYVLLMHYVYFILDTCFMIHSTYLFNYVNQWSKKPSQIINWY